MVSSISSSSTYASQMVSNLFSKLDTTNKGYIEQSDLQSAFNQISSSSSSSDTTSADEVFKKMDTNSDGKVTKQELSDSLTKLSAQLDSQFNSSRMSGTGGMPPPPPPQGADSTGLTKDQLTSMLDQTSSSGSTDSSKLTNLINNFDKADTNGDGKVSMQEAQAYDQSSSSSTSASTSSDSGSATSSSGTASNDASVMMKIMQLMQAYGGMGVDSSSMSTLSTSA